MLTALIAEDELLVKIGISSCVPWAELNVAVVGEASDGMEAWELFQKYRPDIIILDLLMPGLNGIELLQRIRAVDRHCAVIVVTNVGEEDLLEEVQQLGVTQILPKISMKRDDISAAVRRACEAITSETGDTAAQAEDEKRVLEKLLFGSDGQDASPRWLCRSWATRTPMSSFPRRADSCWCGRKCRRGISPKAH